MEFSKGAGFCFFSNAVVCSFRKHDAVGFMARCESCEHYKRFNREMDEEDVKMMDAIDKIHELSASFHRGEICEEEYRKRYFELDREAE